MSSRQDGARFGPATAVAELNDATANDIQPNVRADGLEVVFSSNRTGSQGQDIWGRNAHQRRERVVGTDQPRGRREHGRQRVTAVALEGR